MMHHVPVTIARDTARDLWRAYKSHLHYSTPIDREVMSAYQKLAQGKLVIKALESIVTAGANNQGLPKLAIMRADMPMCHLSLHNDGSCRMRPSRLSNHRGRNTVFNFPTNTCPKGLWKNAEAIVPPVPLHLRPKRAMANYHILWEAEWTKAPPHDPFLLRRLGKGDLWLVLAMWDLTEVEKAALAARL